MRTRPALLLVALTLLLAACDEDEADSLRTDAALTTDGATDGSRVDASGAGADAGPDATP